MPEVQRNVFPNIPTDEFFDLAKIVYQELSYFPDEGEKTSLLTLLKNHQEDHDIIFYHIVGQCRLIGIFPHKGDLCHFAFFEAVESPLGLDDLFAAFHLDASQRRFKEVQGPYHFSTFHRYRTRLSNSSWHQFNGEPVNPPYSESLLNSQHYSSAIEYESRFVASQDVPSFYEDKHEFLETLKQIPFNFHVLNESFWDKRETELYELILAIFGQNPGFKNISFTDFKKLYNPLYAKRLCPHTSVVFEDKRTGELAAICLAQPNYKTLSAAPDFAPSYDIHYSQLEQKTLLLKTVGVHPDFRRQNLMTYLGAYGMTNFKEYYDDCIFCLMRSDNFSMKFTDGLPFQSSKYVLFSKRL